MGMKGMDATMIRLIATDLDDTLLNAQGDVSPRTLKALQAAMARGCGIVLSSGRMPEAMLPLANKIGVNAPMLLYNGALAYDHNRDETLFADRLPYATALSIVDLCERNGWYIQAYPGRGYFCPEILEGTRRYAASIRVEPTPVHRPIGQWMRENPSDMQKLLLIDTPEGADRIQAVLREAFPTGASFIKSRPMYVEVAPEGVNKGSSLLKLAQRLGVAREEVMAFGDGQNDVNMIAAAGTGVCMANGCPQALAAAGRVAPRNTEDGVAQVIEEYLENNMIGSFV